MLKLLNTIRFLIFFVLSITQCCINKAQNTNKLFENNTITVGAEKFSEYLPLLKNKRVGMVVNITSVVGKNNTPLVDSLKNLGIDIRAIFPPEHGFRGTADAGEKVDNSIDAKTGVKIISIYGKKYAPDSTDLVNIDVLIYDIQDVGVRFYTYISTLQYLIEAAAKFNKQLIILDRPNPNGHYVDGFILDTTYKSFVGMQSIPIVYGMTPAEYAQMLINEKMLKVDASKLNLVVIKCDGYSHKTFYQLPIKPSPNIPNMHAVYLYPSLCYFEPTDVSVGRGTDKPFQIFGSPNMKTPNNNFEFTPVPTEGAKTPPLQDKVCYGKDLSALDLKTLQIEAKINWDYLLEAYKNHSKKDSFFYKNNFFEKLCGNKNMRDYVKEQKSSEYIRSTYAVELKKFKVIRKKYLLYPDFE